MKKQTLLVLAILVWQLCNAQNHHLASQKANELLSSFINIANIPGMSVAVSIDNNIVYSNSFGYCDIDKNISTNDSTKYRIGSVTKLFTAVITAKLIEKGIIDADDSISRYIRGFEKWQSRGKYWPRQLQASCYYRKGMRSPY